MLEALRTRLIKLMYEKCIHTLQADSFTVMPRFAFHQPLDYRDTTLPPDFDRPILVNGETLPVPAGADRFGYSVNDTGEYLRWGKVDHELLLDRIDKHYGEAADLHIMDFGCSSGRVLRHFQIEHEARNWTLYGTDLQARAIEWMRRNFPPHYQIFTSSLMPRIPLPDNSLDVIYGISVFTHIKYHWDSWLMELKRVLRPGGLLIQTVQTENAWKFYHMHRRESWVRESQPRRVIDVENMDADYVYHGDIRVSQVFWKRKIVAEFWGRYFRILEIEEPPEKSFQDWVICQKA